VAHHNSPRWRLALPVALGITLLSIIPQSRVWIERGRNWQGSYAAIQGDEWAYSAYVNALRDGRARRNDPFGGNDSSQLPESIFSVQFIPAYAIALPARLLRLSTSTAFIVSIAITAFLSCLAVFWLIGSITGDSRTAAAGALFVLCFGAFIIGQGVVGPLLGLDLHSGYLPFLRRYEPAGPFPLMFVFYTLTWRAFMEERWKAYAITAGIGLVVLIFSYFYLWTAALAWFACFALLCFVVQRNQSRALKISATLGTVLLIPLLIYIAMIRGLGGDLDATQVMVFTRQPDLFRPTEVIGVLVLLLLAVAWRKRLIELKDSAVLFVASCALTPFVVFNQQLLTGRSLQPFHYEVFAVNYLLLVGIVVLFHVLTRAQKRYATILAIVGAVSLAWGAVEMVALERAVRRDPLIDEAARVGRYLETENRQGLVLATESNTANVLPTFAPQPILWAQHHPVYYTPRKEYLERFYQYLYFTGYDGGKLRDAMLHPEQSDGNYIVFRTTLFGHARQFPHLGGSGAPIRAEDVQLQVDQYSAYIAKFSAADADRFPLSYVITPAEKKIDLSNLDKWYERDSGQRIGAFILYRVKLHARVL